MWVRLASAELSSLLSSRSTRYLLAVEIAIILVTLELFARSLIPAFLILVFVVLPTFFIAIFAPSFAVERQEGFAEILYSYPVTKAGFLAARLLSMLTALGLFLLIAVLMSLPIPILAGSLWWTKLARHAVVSVLISLTATLYAYNISLWLGRYSGAVASFVGFAVAIAFASMPLIAYLPQVLTLKREVLDGVLGLLHVSPTMLGLSVLNAHLYYSTDPRAIILVMAGIIAILAGSLLLTYSLGQDILGWKKGILPKLIPIALVAAILVAALPAGGATDKLIDREVEKESLPPDLDLYVRILEEGECICAREHVVGQTYAATLFALLYVTSESEMRIDELVITLTSSEMIRVAPARIVLRNITLFGGEEYAHTSRVNVQIIGSSALEPGSSLLSERIIFNISFGPYFYVDDDLVPVTSRAGYRFPSYVMAFLLLGAVMFPYLLGRLKKKGE
jgi:ABC-type transport system involved in multi-copper enzyme maturation permease subunit